MLEPRRRYVLPSLLLRKLNLDTLLHGRLRASFKARIWDSTKGYAYFHRYIT